MSSTDPKRRAHEERIARTPEPATVASLAADLTRLGVRPGSAVLVHASFASLGWVCGGPTALLHALEHSLGPQGTLVVPTHSGDLSDPAKWVNPPVPEPWWPTIREHMPPYRSEETPTYSMGVVAELFRTWPGVLRSQHPQVSFAARGPHAERITSNHELAYSLGETSPLARLYEIDGDVLLIGVGHESNTSLHLAEYRADLPAMARIELGAPILVDGLRRWVTFPDLDFDNQDFGRLGEDFERGTGGVRKGLVGLAESRLFRQRAIVDYGKTWLERYRQ